MQFPCARCGRTYEIADELCVGRAVKVACPACGNLAVHRVPAPGGAPVAVPEPELPPAGSPSVLADASDEDFESAWSAIEAPEWTPPPPAPAAPPSPAGSRAGAPAGARAGAPAARPAAPAGRPAPSQARRPAPVEEEEPVMVTAELVLRRSTRRARLVAGAVAVTVLSALGGGGWLALQWRRDPAAGAAQGARRGGEGSGGDPASAAGLSAADLAKLMGRKEQEPSAPAAKSAAQAPKRPGKPTGDDRDLLDLLARKGDAPVTVGADEVEALSTSRGTLDEVAIEGTLSRSSGSFTACVNRALAASPDQRLPATRVNLELTIRPSGRVARAAVQEPAIARLPLGTCIAQAAKRMVFPGFDGEAIDLVVPLKLKVGL